MHGRAVTAAPCNVGKKRRKVDKKKRNDAHMTFGRADGCSATHRIGTLRTSSTCKTDERGLVMTSQLYLVRQGQRPSTPTTATA